METAATHELRPKKQMTIYTSIHLYIYLCTSPTLLYEVRAREDEETVNHARLSAPAKSYRKNSLHSDSKEGVHE
jgi:hypothetical protein